MQITLSLPAKIAVALRHYANLEGIELEAAATIAIREWLVSVGYLEFPDEMEENTPTEWSA